MKTSFLALLLFLFVNQSEQASAALSKTGWDLNAEANEIKVMSFNVENLFDSQHDPGKFDGEYLPLSNPLKKTLCQEQYGPDLKKFDGCMATDWTPEKVNLKMIQIEKMVRAQGSLPDVISLVEVENTNVVGEISRRLGYDFVMYEGPDERGIDVALLFKRDKLTFKRSRPISVSRALGKETRDILEVQFNFRGGSAQQVLTFFVNHWSSPFSKPAERFIAADVLKWAIQDVRSRQPQDQIFVYALGDFNVIDSESPSPIYEDLLGSNLGLFDLQRVSDRSNNPLNGQMPPGSHFNYFDRKWSRLDKMILSNNLLDGTLPDVVPQTFRVFGPPGIAKYDAWVNEYIPQKYRTRTMDEFGVGFSDHFPLSTIIRLY